MTATRSVEPRVLPQRQVMVGSKIAKEMEGAEVKADVVGLQKGEEMVIEKTDSMGRKVFFGTPPPRGECLY